MVGGAFAVACVGAARGGDERPIRQHHTQHLHTPQHPEFGAHVKQRQKIGGSTTTHGHMDKEDEGMREGYGLCPLCSMESASTLQRCECLG